MDGVAFSIFGFDVYWYGLIIMMGILVGIVISTKLSKIRGYSSDMILDFILLAVPLGVIGARLYYVVFSWDEFARHRIAFLPCKCRALPSMELSLAELSLP